MRWPTTTARTSSTPRRTYWRRCWPGWSNPRIRCGWARPSRTITSRVRAWGAVRVRWGRRKSDRSRGDHRVLDPGPARAGWWAGHGVSPQCGAFGAVVGANHAVLGRAVHGPASAVPGFRADHRLHRRDHDAVPFRADAGGQGKCRFGG